MFSHVANLFVCLGIAISAFGGTPETSESDLPQVKSVGIVAPKIIMLNISAQRVEFGRQIPYEKQPGDVVDPGIHKFVRRNGKMIGALAGADRKILFTCDNLLGEPLDTQWAMLPASYRILSKNDARFSGGITPVKVNRKSRTSGFVRTAQDAKVAQEHLLYLTLPEDLQVGKAYTVEFANAHLASASVDFVYQPSSLTSEAVHVSQIGYRPDDPVKIAFLSCWMGDGGGVSYRDGLKFSVIDEKSGKSVFDGKTQLAKLASEGEAGSDKNYERSDVYQMDFSQFATPGTYRVSVEGIGCSLPFSIAEDAWAKAFYTSVRGLYHFRSGIELGPPYTDFKRPRSFHPDDGVKVYASSFSAGEANQGEGHVFQLLLAGKSDEIVPNAWGGYMDAADWDRRPLHMAIPRLLMDLYEMAPQKFDLVKLNLPESNNQMPDLLDEAFWLIDFHLRTQTPEGGIRPGIESSEHPRRGEGSWQESLTVMAYAPGPRISYKYAGVAAHAAALLEAKDPQRAKTYKDSALKAFEWAEKHPDNTEPTAEERMLAAVEFFRLTGEQKWHDLFLAKTRFRKADAEYSGNKVRGHNFDAQDQAGWVYLRTDRPGMDQTIKDNVKRALLASADANIAGMNQTAFKWIPSKIRFTNYGTTNNPDAITLVRAHQLTGDQKYLQAIVLSCQYAAGANPLNLCYTTGVGANPVKDPLHEDAYVSGQAPPPGITVFGPIAPWLPVAKSSMAKTDKTIKDGLYPAFDQWPAVESYFDLNVYPPMSEYTVSSTIAPNAYVWGYLAAR